MRKIRIHPAFLVLLVLIIFSSSLINALYIFLAVILHEYAHSYVAKKRGYKLDSLTLMPYGAVLSSEDKIHKQDAFSISIAGIILNLSLCVITIASWWLYPVSYSITHLFFYANFNVALFNLLPVYPLDGARIIISLSKNTMKTLTILKKGGIVLSIILFALFIASIFFKVNFTLGIMAIALYIGAALGTKNEGYTHITEDNPFIKDKKHPIKVETLLVTKDMELRNIYSHFNKNKYLEIKFMDENGKITKDLNENQFLKRLSNYPSTSKISEIFK